MTTHDSGNTNLGSIGTRHLEYVALDDIDPADRNPKGHAPGEIAASIGRFGYLEPVILDERTHRLVAGHGRREELLRRRAQGEEPPEGITLDDTGHWLVPVVRGWSSRDDNDALAAGIALNRLVERGGWDTEGDDGLAAILAELSDTADGLIGVGFSDKDLAAMIRKLDDEPDTDLRIGDQKFSVIIDCVDELQQAELLGRFESEGLNARPLMM